MKNLILLFGLWFFTEYAYAVCSTPIIRTSASANSVLTSTKYNADVNTAYNRINNLPGDCVVDGTITSAKIAAGAVTTTKIADGAVTAVKFAAGVIPEAGRLLRVSDFTSSGTWTKQADVGAVFVQVVGGGGASYHASATNGSTSSFGGHCLAQGGFKPLSSTTGGGIGGGASAGDTNLLGGDAENLTTTSTTFYGASPGYSFIGDFGRGGIGSTSATGPGGGAGGYCAKLIDDSDLGSTETVTIGAGGTNPGTNTTAGRAGIVIIYEYSK